ncbi:GNAT family N-acetyltransferase [Amycolatopsis sp. NPDC051758]|uniref:GNAT family N-acetyltransferase n=1 Tax=Amycolatopsis sp. NPDC051758 TaxID=3363935 RepID=UPI003797F03D
MSEHRVSPGVSPALVERDDLPVRSARDHVWCLDRKHRRVLAGVNCGTHRTLGLFTETCNRCWIRRRPRHTWLVIDHRVPMPVDQADQPDDRRDGIVVVARRPVERAGVGRLEIRLRGEIVAAADLQLCGIDHRGVVRHVQVEPAHRQRGFGTLLLDAALARGPGYHWSTTGIGRTEEARDFWAYQDPAEPLHLEQPHYCTHMRQANGELG